MKRHARLLYLATGLFLMLWLVAPLGVASADADADTVLKFCCSNQVYKAFGKEQVEAFAQTKNTKMKLKFASSASCVNVLMNGYCDVASTARGLYRRHREYGFQQVPFCKDPLAVIVNSKCTVDALTEAQLQDIFSGDIGNWKEVGGPDLEITVVVPSKNSAANKNFRRQVMKHKDIEHDFMAHDSTMAIAAVAFFPPGTISFISQGAAAHDERVKAVRIDGKVPTDMDYPYTQTFFLVTEIDPPEKVKQFIEYAFTAEAKARIRKYGMLPIER